MNHQERIGNSLYFSEITGIAKNWIWFLCIGIFLVILGTLAISLSFYTTVLSVFLLGIFLIGGGLVLILQSFLARKWSGLFIALLLGILYLVTGVLCVIKPGAMAVGLTLWIAAFCLIAGLFRIVNSLVLRFSHWGWVFFNGIVTFILGLIILADWPLSGFWVIGLFVGIDLVLSGWTCILLSMAARSSKKDLV
jgi:uncharacterized membrane protein HdeD (DUF308 family)